MNFDLSDEQQMMVDTVSKFVSNESPVERFRKLRDTEATWEKSVWQEMGEYGWLGVRFPEGQVGFGGSFFDAALILEQFGRGLVPEPYIPSVILAGGLLSRLGTDEQRENFLAPMIEGQATLALAYSERQSRYNPNDCLTTATGSSDGEYLLSGTKTWVLNGHAAEHIIVAARTSGDQLDEDGITFFIVDADAAGLSRTNAKGMDGQTTALITLDGVAVGADRVLGDVG